ncbi:unnamed protein product [Moneuplotes crassus]|uniref:Methylglutaconyl-CoA hydratase, mitochondrial n=1 Tax=Euplotes crassus TaxID=5936 RepID=A0AAD2D2P9_EUPCR|nr:unnamed protein product [Moneuplotes crassus]
MLNLRKRVDITRRLAHTFRCFSTSESDFTVKELGDGVTEFLLDRPAKRNALSKLLIAQFEDAIKEVNSTKDTRVIILRSSAPGMFCAGADLKERKSMTPLEGENFVKTLRRLFHEFSRIQCPTISLVDGATLGGGMELALSSDIRVSTEKAILGFPETSLAIIPGAGGTQTLPRIVGEAVAKELIFTAERISPERALQLGLVNHVEKDFDSAYKKVLEIANKICSNGPIGVQMAKQAISQGIEVSKESGLKIEEMCYAQVLPTADRLEGLKAFAEKRKPVYRGE